MFAPIRFLPKNFYPHGGAVRVYIGFAAAYARGLHQGMLQQSGQHIVAQGLLQIDMPLRNAPVHHASDEVVVHYVANVVLCWQGVFKQHIQIHIDQQALRSRQLSIMDANAGLNVKISQKEFSAIGN
jgi:hypothetical protein